MFAFLRLVGGGATTLTTLKNVYDNCSQHLFYKDQEGDIHETRWQGKWATKNITKTCPEIPKAFSNPISCCSQTGTEYVYFYSENGHIYRLTRDYSTITAKDSFGKWTVIDLTQLAKLDAKPEGDLLCWVIAGNEHIFFNSSNGHIYGIYSSNFYGWRYENLTQKSFAKLAAIAKSVEREDDDLVEDYETIESDNDEQKEEKKDEEEPYEQKQHDHVEGNEADVANENDISGSICGHVGLSGNQYLFYFGKNKSLCSLYWGPPIFNSSSTHSSEMINIEDYHPPQIQDYQKQLWFKATQKFQEISGNINNAFPHWKFSNISGETNLKTLNFFGSPGSHCTNIGSHHVFVVDYPNFHLHEFSWYPSIGTWTHTDLTRTLDLPRLSSSRFVNFASGRYHFCYFIDKDGNIHELRQNIVKRNAPWRHYNITDKLPNLPLALSLYHATTYPINKDCRANVIYFKDTVGHTIHLGCRWLRKDYELSFEDLSVRSPIPDGQISIITKGLIESLSIHTANSMRHVISCIKSFNPWANSKEKNVGEEEEDILEKQLKEQYQKTQREAERLREQKEANDQLAAKLIEYENLMQSYQHSKEELEKLQEILDSTKKELEQNNKKQEEQEGKFLEEKKKLEGELQKANENVALVTNGLSIEQWRKIHLRSEELPECCVCYEETDSVEMCPTKCGHPICVSCVKKLPKKDGESPKCPVCIQDIDHDY